MKTTTAQCLLRPVFLILVLLGASATAAPLRYAEDRAPGIVNPLFATSMSEARLNELIFEGLFIDDKELRSSPCLAAGIRLAEDRLSMVIDLKQGVQWHDGQPFTAADVEFTIRTLKDARTASPEAGRVAWIDTVEVHGDNSVTLTFTHEEYAPQDKLHFKILPKHKFSGTEVKRTDAFRNRPVGTGPYRVTSFNSDNSISLSVFDNYHDKTRLREVMMREVSDKNYQSKLLIYESIEALVRVLPRDLAMLQNSKQVEMYPYQTNSWWYLGFNNRDARLSDQRVRLALNMMIDVEALLAPIGTGDLVSGPFVKSSPFYNHDVRPHPHSPDRAKQLLEEAGYGFDGTQWMKDGVALEFEIAALENLPTAQDVVINIQSQLMQVGIIVKPKFLSAGEWKQHIWRAGKFDMILSQWSFDRNENIYEQFHSNGVRNFTGYASAEVDQMLDGARTSVDPKEKKALLRNAHTQINSDTPMVFLWTLDSYAALSIRVQNVVVHPFYFFTWAQDWNLR